MTDQQLGWVQLLCCLSLPSFAALAWLVWRAIGELYAAGCEISALKQERDYLKRRLADAIPLQRPLGK